MIFHTLQQIAKTWLADIRPLVEAAKHIYLPITPHEVLPRGQDLETMSNVSVNFRLPHPIVAVEDNASCVVLIDPRPGLRGLDEERLFIECVPLEAAEEHYNDSPLERAACEALKAKSPLGVHSVSCGKISSPAQRAGSWLASGEVTWILTGTLAAQQTTRGDFDALSEAAIAAMTHSTLQNVMTAIEELIELARIAS